MDSTVRFHYGRCPCCDRIIPVPSGTEKVYCCYCGQDFLARASIALYGFPKNISFTPYTTIPAREPADSKSKKQEQIPYDSSVPRMMTIRELARELNLSEYGVRAMVKQGTIPSVKVGSKYLLNYNKVCELLNQGLLGY